MPTVPGELFQSSWSCEAGGGGRGCSGNGGWEASLAPSGQCQWAKVRLSPDGQKQARDRVEVHCGEALF